MAHIIFVLFIILIYNMFMTNTETGDTPSAHNFASMARRLVAAGTGLLVLAAATYSAGLFPGEQDHTPIRERRLPDLLDPLSALHRKSFDG
jgi:hypothetical protein